MSLQDNPEFYSAAVRKFVDTNGNIQTNNLSENSTVQYDGILPQNFTDLGGDNGDNGDENLLDKYLVKYGNFVYDVNNTGIIELYLSMESMNIQLDNIKEQN